MTESCIVDDPAQTQRELALCRYFYRDLVVGTADPADLEFKHRHDVAECLFEYFHRILLGLLFNDVECIVENVLSSSALAIDHDLVDQFCDELGVIDRIRKYITLCYITFSWHLLFSSLLLGSLRLLSSIQGTALVASVNACAVERTSDDVVTNTREVLDTAAADHNDRVFLEVMSDTRNVSSDFHAVGKTDTGIFTKCRVRLLRCHGADTSADSSLLRAVQFGRGTLQRVESPVQCR